MLSEAELKLVGVRALVAALGDVEAEKFITLILREPFDYTLWQRSLLPSSDVDAISKSATRHRSQTKK